MSKYRYRNGDYQSTANFRKVKEHCRQLYVVFQHHPDTVSSLIDSDLSEHSFRGRIRKMYHKLQVS